MKNFLYSAFIIFAIIYALSKCNQNDVNPEAVGYKSDAPKMDAPKIVTPPIDYKAESIAKVKWDKSKAGKIQKKHPTWSDDDCDNVSKNQIWIGMSYDMLIYERGKPNTVNPSNYGNGAHYQCCWDDYTPSCFYMGEDDIITAYN